MLLFLSSGMSQSFVSREARTQEARRDLDGIATFPWFITRKNKTLGEKQTKPKAWCSKLGSRATLDERRSTKHARRPSTHRQKTTQNSNTLTNHTRTENKCKQWRSMDLMGSAVGGGGLIWSQQRPLVLTQHFICVSTTLSNMSSAYYYKLWNKKTIWVKLRLALSNGVSTMALCPAKPWPGIS